MYCVLREVTGIVLDKIVNRDTWDPEMCLIVEMPFHAGVRQPLVDCEKDQTGKLNRCRKI